MVLACPLIDHHSVVVRARSIWLTLEEAKELVQSELPGHVTRITSISGHETPTVSLVIPSVRRSVDETLCKAVETQSRPPVETLWVFDQDRKGAAWARNQGLIHASGEFVAFLDDDCIPPTNWLARLMETAKRFSADVVGGTYEETDEFLASCRRRRDFPDSDVRDDLGYVGTGGNIVYRRSVLAMCQDVDGFVFNESFHVSQDWELAIRCRRLGVVFAFSTVRVKHLKRLGRITYLRHQFGRGKGIAALHKRIEEDSSLQAPHRSLLWSNTALQNPLRSKWAPIFWRKVCGPFDVSSFDKKSDFVTFWLGEKAQGIGFVSGLLPNSLSFSRSHR